MNLAKATAAVAAHRPHVADLAQRIVPEGHREEGERVGALGVLIALKTYDPEGPGPVFWDLARPHVLDEMERWFRCGTYVRLTPRKPEHQ